GMTIKALNGPANRIHLGLAFGESVPFTQIAIGCNSPPNLVRFNGAHACPEDITAVATVGHSDRPYCPLPHSGPAPNIPVHAAHILSRLLFALLHGTALHSPPVFLRSADVRVPDASRTIAVRGGNFDQLRRSVLASYPPAPDSCKVCR